MAKRDITYEHLIAKIEHYKTNPVDFIKDYGHIRLPGGVKKFNLFDYQERLANNLQNNRFNIILKARQLGISTIVGAYIGTYAMFNPHSDIIIIATNEVVAKELILKTKIFYDFLPNYARPKILNPNNKESIDLENGSRIKASTSSKNAGRSFTASFLIMDECAFISNAKDIWTSAYPSLSNGGRAILLSSPSGEGNLFYDVWTGAESGENEFIPTKLYWWDMPGRDEKWKRVTLANLGYDERRFEQEYACSFLSSSNSVVKLDKLHWHLKKNKDAGIKAIDNFKCIDGGEYKNLFVYKKPEADHVYIFGVDTAEGLGQERDASSIVAIDVTTNEVMMEFNEKDMNEKVFAKALFEIAKTFNNALVVIELRSTGKMVANYLIDWEYSNLFWSDRRMSIYNDGGTNNLKNMAMSNKFDENAPENTLIPGIATNRQNKIIFINEMKVALEENELVNIYTNKMLEQQKVYINKGTTAGGTTPTYGASGRNNDDLVMAFSLAMYIKKYIWDILGNNNSLTDSLIKYFSKNSIDMSDSKTMSEMAIFAPVYNTKKFHTGKFTNPYNYGDQMGDVTWLFENVKKNHKPPFNPINNLIIKKKIIDKIIKI